jgi:hypothetical protein
LSATVVKAVARRTARVPVGPKLTAQGLRKFLSRESNPCGPGLLTLRIRAVVAAEKQDEPKLLAGALEDLAAASVGYAYRLRSESGVWPKESIWKEAVEAPVRVGR